jgi:hypothetical protein
MAEKREVNEPHPGDKRPKRRDAKGRFAESGDRTRSLDGDRQQDAEQDAEPGQGERGDRQH